MNNIAFLCYDSRSGSTLLSSELNKYAGIVVSRETAFVSRILISKEVVTLKTIPVFLEYLFEEVQFQEFGLSKVEIGDRLKKLKDFSKKELIYTIIELYFSKYGKESKLKIIKHPPIKYMKEVIEIFPNVKFIHVVRDGRAVFNSKSNSVSINGHLMDTNPVKAAYKWRQIIKVFDKYHDRTIEIKYEDFLLNSENTLKKFFLYFDINHIYIDKNEKTKYETNIGVSQKHLHENLKYKPIKDKVTQWKDHISKEDRLVYEFLNKGLLKRKGYEDYMIDTVDNLMKGLTFLRVVKYVSIYCISRLWRRLN